MRPNANIRCGICHPDGAWHCSADGVLTLKVHNTPLETFPIVKCKDIAAHEEYRTKRVIIEMYEQMAALPTLAVPAPRDERATYPVPDVSLWSP